MSKLTKTDREAYALATARDDGTCQRCRRRGIRLERDHRKPRSLMGPTAASNLQLLCSDCHRWKTEHPHAAIVAGFTCPGWAKPDHYPARRFDPFTHQPIWVLYDDAGNWEEIPELEAIERQTGEHPGVRVGDPETT